MEGYAGQAERRQSQGKTRLRANQPSAYRKARIVRVENTAPPAGKSRPEALRKGQMRRGQQWTSCDNSPTHRTDGPDAGVFNHLLHRSWSSMVSSRCWLAEAPC